MHVAQVIQYFEVGGIERLVLALGKGLAPRGVKTTVFAYVGSGAFERVLREAGLETVFLETRPGVQAALPARFLRDFRRRGVDLVHTHHLGPFLYGGPAALALRLPVVHTEHSVELYDTRRRRLVGRLLPRAAEVVTVSRELATYRTTTFGDHPTVIENGVSLGPLPSLEERFAARDRLGIARDAFVVGSVARLAREKAPAVLVAAFARVAQRSPRPARLVLVGDGPERSAIEADIRSRGLESLVLLLGRQDDVARILPAFDVFGLASEREGLPLAVLEAMATGIPAVTTAVGALPALLESGGGTTVPASDPEALASALVRYLDPVTVASSGSEARRRVEENHSSHVMLDRYYSLYQRLTAHRGR